MKKIKNIILFLIVLQSILALSKITVQADGVGQWAPDARVPGYLDDTFTPFLVADQDKTVHACYIFPIPAQ